MFFKKKKLAGNSFHNAKLSDLLPQYTEEKEKENLANGILAVKIFKKKKYEQTSKNRFYIEISSILIKIKLFLGIKYNSWIYDANMVEIFRINKIGSKTTLQKSTRSLQP